MPRLRALAVAKSLTHREERLIAAEQALLLLALRGVEEPPVTAEIIAALPGIHVEYRHDAPLSGLAIRHKPHHWRIIIAAHEPHTRHRFSIAHEFKHVLDDPFIKHVHRGLTEHERSRRAEQICNYFAACLLMPSHWIKADWASGRRGVRELASRYGVSAQAMGTRLHELGRGYGVFEADDGQEGRTNG